MKSNNNKELEIFNIVVENYINNERKITIKEISSSINMDCQDVNKYLNKLINERKLDRIEYQYFPTIQGMDYYIKMISDLVGYNKRKIAKIKRTFTNVSKNGNTVNSKFNYVIDIYSNLDEEILVEKKKEEGINIFGNKISIDKMKYPEAKLRHLIKDIYIKDEKNRKNFVNFLIKNSIPIKDINNKDVLTYHLLSQFLGSIGEVVVVARDYERHNVFEIECFLPKDLNLISKKVTQDLDSIIKKSKSFIDDITEYNSCTTNGITENNPVFLINDIVDLKEKYDLKNHYFRRDFDLINEEYVVNKKEESYTKKKTRNLN